MLKSDLVETVAKELNMNHDITQLVINNIFDTMTEALAKGESIEIRGFGSFSIRHYKGREGRNPKTGEKVTVPPARNLSLK